MFPPPPQRAVTLTAQTAGRIYRQGGQLGLYRDGAGRTCGIIYTGVRLHTTHTIFLQSSSLLGFFFLFLFAKTIILNKCRLFVFLFSSCGRKRLGVEWAAPYFYPAIAQTPTQNLLLPWADREPVPREGHQATDGENQCP